MLSSFLHSKRMRPVCCFPHTHKDDACAKRTPTKQTSLPPSDSGRSTQLVVCARNRVWIGGARPFPYSRAVSEAARRYARRTLQQPFSQRSKRTLVSPNRKRGLRVVFHTPTKMMRAQKRLQRNKRRSFLLTPESLCSRLSARGIEYRSAGRPSFLTVAQSQRQRGDVQGGHCNNLFLKDRKELLFLPTASEASVLFSIHPQR